MEFPRLVYRSASSHKQVADADEHAQALASGWFSTVPEAMAGKPDDAPIGRDELEEMAGNLGIKFDGRTSDNRLRKLIDEAI